MPINNSGTHTINELTQIDTNNNGEYISQVGLFEINGNLSSSTGTGKIGIQNSGTFEVDKAVSGNTITFLDNTGTLIIGQLGLFASTATINGLQAGDSIQIPGLPTGFKESYSGGKLVISNPGSFGAVIGTLVFGGTAPSLSVVQNAVTQCFASGTRIATPEGPRLIESLKAGDTVLREDGGAGEIEWKGSREVDCQRHPRPEKVWPVRIATHAFSRGVPTRDLVLSPDHAVLVDGVLIPVKHLINGSTIRQIKARKVTYHHIELRDHAIVRAEGLSLETLLPGSDKTAFATNQGVVQLHPDLSARNWEALSCAPLVVTGPKLEAARRRLNRRAAAIGPWRLRRTG
jgi:hypothetical protein